MVEQQVRPWDVLDDRVLHTLQAIPRDLYVPSQYTSLAYADTAIPLNTQQCMMHPIIEGRLLQLLEIQPEDNVLEIGTGSGFLTACLASLACHVESVEIDAELAEAAKQRLQKHDIQNVSISCGNGLQLANPNIKYNVIVLTGSVSEIPQNLKQALAPKGRMFVVSGAAPAMQAQVLTRTTENDWANEIVFETVLASLTHGEAKPGFTF
jgi:protein-L-isoaspartate(D-aspartate) O-methyltransferase